MTVDNDVAEPARLLPGPRRGLADEARDLLAGLAREPWGQSSPSVYETARLVSLAPWLPAHVGRLSFLLATQRADGAWGPPDGYALVPTLSATEALLATAKTSGDQADLRAAAGRGVLALFNLLHGPGAPPIPDTPAADLIVPALVERINEHLDAHGNDHAVRRLPLPDGMAAGRLAAIRARFASGAAVPQKLLHALEVLGEAARDVGDVRPVPPGTVGASPAATAAWLGGRFSAPGPGGAADDARAYLDTVARRHGGPVPCATPITAFERAWVLGGLARAGVPLDPLPTLVESLTADNGPSGTPAGPGLPADADTTSVALFALAELGYPADPAVLWAYDTGEHFCTWPGEDGFSVTTNAHVLDAFGHHALTADRSAPRYAAALHRLSGWLCAQQDDDGAWLDRWHSSPYYATACCVLALARFGRGRAVAPAIARAVDRVVAAQRPDGSWGRWSGTVEETAYALHVLLAPGAPARPDADPAARRGQEYLISAVGRQPDPPLWHDKDLYAPAAIIRAGVLSAHQLIRRRK
ncbi:prenyltransferase [Dactylosporangium darangshiense]|uniref:Squalene cyclase C-terminal domain-containing protein n=1 Tax=Dactylosporangium darangshiense TaxID=579108 RepID=A0ABP8DVQ0_9ACTN